MSMLRIALVVSLVVLSDPCSAEVVPLRAMSFNVRVAVPSDAGVSAWSQRAERAIQVIRDYNPDILGTQEVLNSQLMDLAGETLPTGLSNYTYYGVGRDDGGSGGEHMAIFWRTERFAWLDSGSFWLSQTPGIPGSIYPGAAYPRLASWVRLEDYASGQQLIVMNTHFDHVSDFAKLYSATLIREQLALMEVDAPILLMGDLNTVEFTQTFKSLIGANDPAGLQLNDSYREVHPGPNGNERTSHGFQGGTQGYRIDYILHTDELVPVDASIVRTSFGGFYPSDHYPVTADFTLAVVPEPSSLALAVAATAIAAWASRSRSLVNSQRARQR